jgi:hypothetical protein
MVMLLWRAAGALPGRSSAGSETDFLANLDQLVALSSSTSPDGKPSMTRSASAGSSASSDTGMEGATTAAGTTAGQVCRKCPHPVAGFSCFPLSPHFLMLQLSLTHCTGSIGQRHSAGQLPWLSSCWWASASVHEAVVVVVM